MKSFLLFTAQISWALCGLWFAAVWRFFVHHTDGPGLLGTSFSLHRLQAVLVFVVVAFTGILLGTPQLWLAIGNGFSGDSLFTLKPVEIVGVLAISLVLIVLFFWLLMLGLAPMAKAVAGRSFRRAGVAILSVIGSLLIFGIAHTLSPQIYYAYYRKIIPGLPDQWVIKTWLDWPRLAEAAAFHGNGSLSSHLTGLVFWSIVIFVLWVFSVRWREEQWQASPIQVGLTTAALFAGLQFS